MVVAISLVFFALGAVCASFIGLAASRLYTGASIVSGRSRCDACGAALSPLALVPVLSWLISRGACGTCSSRISFSLPLAEVVLGLLFVCTYLKLGLSPALPFTLAALVLLLGLVLYDLAHSILPPILLALFIAATLSVAFTSASDLPAFAVTFLTALLLSSLLALIHLASNGRAMGLADAPLVFGLALLAGPQALSGLMFSFWIGAVVGLIILARRPAGTKMGSEVPFAPFLATGFLLAYFTSWNAFALAASLMNALLV